MSDIHIDDFYRDTAKILVSLYNHFPRKMTLFVEDIAGADTPDEFGLHSTRHLACLHTMIWLSQTGYLTHETLVRQEALDQAVLSHRSFLLLSHYELPASSDSDAPTAHPHEDASLIHLLRRELKQGTSFSLGETVRELMERSRHFA